MAIAQAIKMLDLDDAGQVRSMLDLINLSRKGLPNKTLGKIEQSFSVKNKDLARLLSVSIKTIERYKAGRGQHLNHVLSERILKLAMVNSRCLEIFEDRDDCNTWLKSKNVALGGQPPIDLLDSDFGIELVLTELGRIEHGIIS